jgi:hypothetical protein
MTEYKVGYFVGSLAKGSINRRLAKALVRLAPDDLEMTEIPFGDLPLYSYDYDADFPPAGKAMGRELLQLEAVGDHRHLAGRDRHRGRAAAPPLDPQLLQLAADERDRSLHPVHP